MSINWLLVGEESILKSKFKFWLGASVVAAMLFSLSGLGLAFDSAYTVQDDARQHVFWLQRLNDSDLFPQDLIADYFSSVAPAGYKFLYWLANWFGINPFLFSKILPVLLGVGTSVYLYLVTIEIFSVPLAGFLASLLLNQNLWILNDLVSGTPRAFFYVLFLGFIYYLLRRELFLCLLLLVLQGLFYPQIVLISSGIFILRAIHRQDKYFYLIGLVTAVFILAVYKLQAGEFTNVITLEAAQQLPEFYPDGRSAFFSDKVWYFWLFGERSGFFPFEWQYFALCSFGLLLPIIYQFPRQFSLVRQLNRGAAIIWQMLLASLGLFCLAHVMLFRLHLPSRYSQHTWRIAIALMGGIVLAIFLQYLCQRIIKGRISQWLAIAITITIILIPTIEVQHRPYRLSYVTGQAPKLYRFLQQQPKDITIATLSKEADFIPSLAQRSVLVSREYSIPYHWDYYGQIRQRTRDLIQAQYSSQTDLERFIRKYQVDLWLLDRQAFSVEYLKSNSWLNQFSPEIQNAIASLQQSQPEILSQRDRCSIFQTTELYLLDAKCLLDEKSFSRGN